MFTAHDVTLQGTVINLPPAGVEVGEDLILAASHEWLHLLKAELTHPLPVRQQVAHAFIKHRHGHRGIFDEHPHGLGHFAVASGGGLSCGIQRGDLSRIVGR